MLFKRSLQFRIFLSYAIFGAVLGIVLFLFLYFSYNLLEEKLIAEHLDDEMQFFVELVRKNPAVNSLRTKKLIGYRLAPTEKIKDFPFLPTLPPGIHEITHAGQDYVIQSTKINNNHYFILYDITDFETAEHWLNAVFSLSILLVISGSIWYGYTLGDHVLAPVKLLADKLKLLSPDKLDVKLSQDFANDEVGSLAESFDTYLERMRAFVEREHYFASDASHELRTPLAVIQGATEMLLTSDNLTRKDHDKLLRIHRAVTNMSRSIAALLILAREPNKSESPESQGGISIADIVNDTIEACHALVDQSQLKIELQIEAEPEIEAPDVIVSLLVNNLLQNAIRYTPRGEIRVLLDTSQLVVTDTGIGIPQPDIEKIFDRGFRGKNVSSDGSGLGLSLVKRICDHFNWRIKVSSQPGEGSVVTWQFQSNQA
ncbi:sensor histidine kinase [Kaarinaea lacus]